MGLEGRERTATGGEKSLLQLFLAIALFGRVLYAFDPTARTRGAYVIAMRRRHPTCILSFFVLARPASSRLQGAMRGAIRGAIRGFDKRSGYTEFEQFAVGIVNGATT